MKKTFLFVTAVCIVTTVLLPTRIYADGHTNPPVGGVKQKIANEAREQGIPPEILKAIAANESNYKQFDADGSPHISSDGGIGIMQVTPDNVDMDVDKEKLKTDSEYNIRVGAQVLLNKWNLDFLPQMNDHDKAVLEDWYFAVMAYNGLSKTNDPTIHSGDTYQEKIYRRIEQSSLLYGENESYFEFPDIDINYKDNNDTIFFPPDSDHYETGTTTPSQQMYDENDTVFIDEREGFANIRHNGIRGDATPLWPYTPLTLTNAYPIESSNPANDFAYYHVSGIDVKGYVASAYINDGHDDMVFNDTMDDHRAAAQAFVSMKNYANGYPSGDFGSNDRLKREHAAVILANILSLDAPDDYDIQASDAESIDDYREPLRKAEYNGLLGGGGKLRPKEYVTRAQMAQIMSEAFESYYEKPESMHSFDDAKKIWNLEEVNTMYHNHITTADPFRPNETITRSQFAIFIYRTMVDVETSS
ncbi:hypothetical protein GCM10008983_09650 [Lentibacillus halophilus]|uniref:SLH domain-containing protein n=1 Tax=Lentibacillus halophilus TaxID=295065 RepID=A0ABN0Z5X1_9BACI